MTELDLLTVPEVAALLRVRSRWVYDAAAKGLLPSARIGKHLRFRRSDVVLYAERAFALRAG